MILTIKANGKINKVNVSKRNKIKVTKCNN